MHQVYPHGLVQGNLEFALQGLFEADALLLVSTVAWLKTKWEAELVRWQSCRLEDGKPCSGG